MRSRPCRDPSQRPRELWSASGFVSMLKARSPSRSSGSARDLRAAVRPLRLATGLILFAFATSHFIGHAFGVRSVAAMQAASVVFLKPWQTSLGLCILYGAFFIHAALGLRALYRRRHLRIPASEAWQLALGLAIPLLVLPHAGSIRLGSWLYGLE